MYRSKPEILRFQPIPPVHFSFTVPLTRSLILKNCSDSFSEGCRNLIKVYSNLILSNIKLNEFILTQIFILFNGIESILKPEQNGFKLKPNQSVDIPQLITKNVQGDP